MTNILENMPTRPAVAESPLHWKTQAEEWAEDAADPATYGSLPYSEHYTALAAVSLAHRQEMIDAPAEDPEMTMQDPDGTDYPEMRRVTATQGPLEFGFTQELDVRIGDCHLTISLHENQLLTIRCQPERGQTVGFDLHGVRPRPIDLTGMAYHRASHGR